MVENIEELYTKTRTEGFGKEVKKRIMLGNFVLSADYYDSYYTQAQKVRRRIKTQIDEGLNHVTAFVLPTSPQSAWPVLQNNIDPLREYYADIFTVLANLIGSPAISLPVGKNSHGLPLGIQYLAKQGQDKCLFNFLTKYNLA